MKKKYIPRMNGSVVWITTDPTFSHFSSIQEERFLEDVIQDDMDFNDRLELIMEAWEEKRFSYSFLNYCFLRLAQLQEIGSIQA